MAADGSLIFNTGIDSSGFSKGLSGLTTAAGTAAAAITAAFAGAAAAAVSVGTSYTSAMSQVAATMGITTAAEEYTLLSEAAKEMGATTKYSASQAADALNYLALAGYDAQQSVNALPTVLNLAAAGGIDLAYASDMVTDSMSALGLGMDEMEGFADKLAKTSQKSNTSVAQLGEAILTVGGTAKSLAGGVEELNTMLGVIADNGVKGAEGGTALRNVILSLSAPTSTAAAEMEKLGIEAYDLNGNLRYLPDVFADFNTALSSLTEGEKTQALNNIFNKVDLKTVNALLGTSAERFDELAGYIADCDGAAAQMAETMSDNLEGDLLTFQSALEAVSTSAFEKFEGSMRNVVQTATEILGRLNAELNGQLAQKLVNLGEAFSEIAVSAAEFAVDKGLPMLIDGLSRICDHTDEVSEAAKVIAAVVISFKGLTAANKVITGIEKLTTAFTAAAASGGTLAGVMAVIPWTAAAALAIGAAAALASYIEKQREVIGYEGEIKEAFNEANREIALHSNYLSELADSDKISDNRQAYETAITEAEEYREQLDKNKRKIEDLRRALSYMNVYDAPETYDKYEQEIAGLEEQNAHLEAALIARNHIIERFGDLDSIDEMFEIHPERYMDQDILNQQNENALAVLAKYSDISNRQTAAAMDIADGWKTLDHQYAIGAIATEQELYAKKKALLDEYGDSSLEEHWKYYEELYSYEKSFAADEQRLEEERLEESRKKREENLKLQKEAQEKALDNMREVQKKALSSVQKNLADILSEYSKAYSDYESNVKGYKAKLLSVGDVFTFTSETDKNGNTTNTYSVENIKRQMEEMRKYHEYVKQLKAQGASAGLIEELTSMDFEQGAQFGKFLAGMSSSDFADINELYRQRDELAQELAEDMYSDDLNNINTALTNSIYGALDGLPEQAQAAGKQLLEGLLSGIDISSADLSEYTSAFSEGFSEMYENAIENMDLRSSFEYAFAGVDTYSMGTDMAQQFASGFNAELARLTADVSAGQVNFDVNTAASGNVSGNGSKSEEKIVIENSVHTTVELDGNKVGETVTKYQNENMRRRGI
ncbi:MAG: phage tail tape measure protein [Ruminococcus sp.]|nr:phage tail tape measure protein [Ruminococcus sp.]